MKLAKLLVAGSLAIAANLAFAGGLSFINNTDKTFTPACKNTHTGQNFKQSLPLPPSKNGRPTTLPWVILYADGAGIGQLASCEFNDGSANVYHAEFTIHSDMNSGDVSSAYNTGDSTYKVTIDQSNPQNITVTLNNG
ncbi:MAG: hypothetical protein P1U40_01270 [Coxiellaceae bacterium]|nr:hypothetical protein [Coxiellaceae bacterium]